MPERLIPDHLIVSLDLLLPIGADEDPVLYSTMLEQMADTLRQVYGIEIKHTAGTVSESVYDQAVAEPTLPDGTLCYQCGQPIVPDQGWVEMECGKGYVHTGNCASEHIGGCGLCPIGMGD